LESIEGGKFSKLNTLTYTLTEIRPFFEVWKFYIIQAIVLLSCMENSLMTTLFYVRIIVSVSWFNALIQLLHILKEMVLLNIYNQNVWYWILHLYHSFVTPNDNHKIYTEECFMCMMEIKYTVSILQEYPWILSSSDDQTIRIWNWQSRNCIW
jgi:WD40 repeat protein